MIAAQNTPLLIALGAIVGIVIGWLVANARTVRARAQLEAAERRAGERDVATERCAQLERELAGAQARADQLGQQQVAEVRAMAESIKNDLLKASNAFAGEQSATFAKTANERIGALVEPVGKKLADLDKLVHDLETTRARQQGQLSGQIEGLIKQAETLGRENADLRSQTSTLVSALKNPRMQGEWGEMQLRRVVELAGMAAYADFDEQRTVGENDLRRPDLTISLPDAKRVFVDSKAPIGGMVEIAAATDDGMRRERVRAHAAAIKNHIDGLARKSYQNAEDSLDFVVMFVPGEGSLAIACTENPSLIEYALSKNVFLASPLSLILLLQSFSLGWQRVLQNDNAREIAKLGRDLYESVANFGSHLDNLGKGLKRAAESYNEAIGSYERRVLVRGRKLKERAALAHDDLPEPPTIDVSLRAVTLPETVQPSLLPPEDDDEG